MGNDIITMLVEGPLGAASSADLVALFNDLIALSRLSFRQKSYDEAVEGFEEARRIYDAALAKNPSALPDDFTVVPLLTLLGNTYSKRARRNYWCYYIGFCLVFINDKFWN